MKKAVAEGLFFDKQVKITRMYVFVKDKDSLFWNRWTYYEILLRREFWKAFGKAMDWNGEICKHCGTWKFRNSMIGYSECCQRWAEGSIKPYLFFWHLLIEMLDTGHTINEYFESLNDNTKKQKTIE